jgi:hypothetical protein
MIQTQYAFIHFVHIADKPKTQVWSCRNSKSGDELGQIKWYPAWRQYCYFPNQPAIYSKGCLLDIISFMEELSLDHRG